MIKSKLPTKKELDIVLRALKLTIHSTCGQSEFTDEELKTTNELIKKLEKVLGKGN